MPILRACARCGTPFEARSPRHRHCRNCTSPLDRSPTTRTRPSSSTEREHIRQLVLDRDPHCQLRLDGCTGTSTVADHIVPAAHGGLYHPANLRGACHHCNSVRGGQQTSALEHGHDDRPARRSVPGESGAHPVGPTRLA